MSTARKGNQAELRVQHYLEDEQGWTCGQRRHVGGAGDILAVHPRQRPRLIEVKATRGGPYKAFSRADRTALRERAEQIGADALLAHVPSPTKPIRWLPSDQWPK